MTDLIEPPKQKVTTPAGRAGYAFVDKPSTKFNPDGDFSIKVTLSATEAAPIVEALTAMLDAQMAFQQQEANRAAASKGQKPKDVKRADLPITENEDGSVTLSFKKKAMFRPKDGTPIRKRVLVLDGQKKPYTGRVWQGSLVRVSGMMLPWYVPATGAGVRMQVEAVQVLQLADPTEAYSADFDEDPEGFAAEAAGVEVEGDPAHTGDF